MEVFRAHAVDLAPFAPDVTDVSARFGLPRDVRFQFHPEKSGVNGLKILRAFVETCS